MDGDQVKSFQDLVRFAYRDPRIAPVMEKEVLSKHRQALMLLGMFHLLYSPGRNAVSIYEKGHANLPLVPRHTLGVSSVVEQRIFATVRRSYKAVEYRSKTEAEYAFRGFGQRPGTCGRREAMLKSDPRVAIPDRSIK
jgi:hypothetical protein